MSTSFVRRAFTVALSGNSDLPTVHKPEFVCFQVEAIKLKPDALTPDPLALVFALDDRVNIIMGRRDVQQKLADDVNRIVDRMSKTTGCEVADVPKAAIKKLLKKGTRIMRFAALICDWEGDFGLKCDILEKKITGYIGEMFRIWTFAVQPCISGENKLKDAARTVNALQDTFRVLVEGLKGTNGRQFELSSPEVFGSIYEDLKEAVLEMESGMCKGIERFLLQPEGCM